MTTTKTQDRPVTFGLPADSGWRCACDCRAHMDDVNCEMLNAPGADRYCGPCTTAVELGLIKTLGSLIRDAVDYPGRDRDLANLRKVYALCAAGDVRWADFLVLWIAETPSTRAAGGAKEILVFHTNYGMAEVPPAMEPMAGVAPKTERQPVTEDGMYRVPRTGEIFKVQFNKAQGDGRRLYAKKMVGYSDDGMIEGGWLAGREPIDGLEIRFEYAAGAMKWLDASWKMTLEEAKAFGALYGTCCVCGRTLTDERSIAAGIGPICANKF